MQLSFQFYADIALLLRIMRGETSKRPGEKLALTRGCSSERDEKSRGTGGGASGEEIDMFAPCRGAVNAYYACKAISPIKIAITYFRDR